MRDARRNQEGKRGSKNCIGIPVIPFYMKYRRWVIFFRYFNEQCGILESATHGISGFQKINFTCHVMGRKSLACTIFGLTSLRIPSSILDALSFPCSGVLTRKKAMSCKWFYDVFEGSTLRIDVVSRVCCIQCLLISLQLEDFQK